MYYSYENIKFEGDILYTAYILNLILQDILKALIKDDYNLLNNNNGFEISDNLLNNIIINNSSKFIY